PNRFVCRYGIEALCRRAVCFRPHDQVGKRERGLTGNKPEAILIGDHGLSCLLAEKLSLRDLRLLQQYRHLTDKRTQPSNGRYWGYSGQTRSASLTSLRSD